MKIKSRYTSLIAIFLSLVTVLGSAFGLWFFHDISHGITTVKQNLRIDDIYENYAFGKPSLDSYFELYIYPSALYYDIYNDSSLKRTGTSKDDVLWMENLFGYNELVSDSDGAIEGDATFNLVTKNGYNSSYYGDAGYNRYIEDKNIDGNYDYYLGNTNDEKINTFKIYEIVKKTDNQVYAPLNDLYNSSYYDNVSGIPHEDPYYQVNRPNPHFRDRFGVFSDLAYNAGRTLPLKINIKNALNIDTFLKAIKRPYTSIADGSQWFDFRHVSWYPLSKNNNQYTSAMDAFRGTDTNKFFSLTNDLSSYVMDSYVDESTGKTKNIIRLLPTFSNGKNRSASSPSNGARDSFKLTVDYKDNTLTKKYFMQYINDSLTNNSAINSYSANNIKYATIPPIYLDNNVNSINLTGAIVPNKSDNEATAGWYDGWPITHNLNSDAISRLVENYGAGLYRPIVFVGNSSIVPESYHERPKWEYKVLQGYEYTPYYDLGVFNDSNGGYKNLPERGTDYINAFTAINKQLNTNSHTISEYATSSDGFHFLKNKNLIQFDGSYNNIFSGLNFISGDTATDLSRCINRHVLWGCSNMRVEIKHSGSGWQDDQYLFLRPVELAFEKIENIACIPSIDSDDTYTEHNNKIDSLISNGIKMFREGRNSIYDKSIVDTNPATLTSINLNNDQTYLVRNLDFRDIDALHRNFQFRFSENYARNPTFNLNPSINKVLIKPNNVSGVYMYDTNNVFEKANRYFTYEDITFKNNTGSEKVIKLKDTFIDNGGNTKNLYPGVYDFLIIRDLNATTLTYDVYCYRHMNIFVKLFADQLDENNRNSDSTINHINTGNNTLRWIKQYGIGDYIVDGDYSDDTTNGLVSIKDAITTIYNEKKALNPSISGLKIFDHVSKSRIGYFDGTDLTLNLNITKNHILYTRTY